MLTSDEISRTSVTATKRRCCVYECVCVCVLPVDARLTLISCRHTQKARKWKQRRYGQLSGGEREKRGKRRDRGKRERGLGNCTISQRAESCRCNARNSTIKCKCHFECILGGKYINTGWPIRLICSLRKWK